MLSVLPSFNDLSVAINELNKEYPRPNMKVSLSERLSLKSDYNQLQDWFGGVVGVYVLFNEDQEVVRIGSATNDLYARLNCYFDYLDEKEIEGCAWTKEGVSAKYIQAIVVPKEQVFEALAIESFLLNRLTPPLNKEGKSKYLWYREKMVDELNRLSNVYDEKNIDKSWYT